MASTEQNRLAFARLSATAGFAYCSYAMCRSPVLPLFARQLGATPEVVGVLVGASTVTGILVKLPAGALSDVFGRRALLAAGALVFALLPFAYLPVAGLGWLILLRLLHGNATAIFGPVASAALSDLAPPDRRGRWLGTYSAVQGAGQTIGPVIAGYLIAAGDFDPAFFVSGIMGLVALALVLGWRRDGPVRTGVGWWRHAAEGIREVWADRRILTTSLAQAGQFFVNGTVHAFVPLYAREVLAFTAPQIGLVFGVQTASTLLTRPLFGAVSDRVGRRPLIISGLLTCASAITAISLVAGFGPLLSASAAYGAGLAITTAATSAYVTDLARQARYGAAHGVFGTIYDIGDAAGPMIAGLLVASSGYREMFRVVSVAAAVLAVVFWLLSRTWQNARA